MVGLGSEKTVGDIEMEVGWKEGRVEGCEVGRRVDVLVGFGMGMCGMVVDCCGLVCVGIGVGTWLRAGVW